MFFDGCKCPVCGNMFKPDDDVVACPECGTPHHRSCYTENNSCANASLHADGYEWKRSDEADESGASQTGITCGICGTLNPEGRLYCQNCASRLSTAEYRPDNGQRLHTPEANREESENGYYSYGGNIIAIKDGDLIDNVPVGDIKRFVGNLWMYYIPLFMSFCKNHKSVSFNLPACFLHGIWFISRKMYTLGTALLAVMLGIAGIRAYYAPTLLPLYESFMDGDSTAMTEFALNHPLLTLGLAATTVIQYGVYIFSGLFANRIYMSHCVRTVRSINAVSKNADEFNSALEKRGGSAMLLSLIVAVVFFIVQYKLNLMSM